VLPVTRWTFLCGALALAGVPVFSGFWSKDMVLESALSAGNAQRFGAVYTILFGVGLATALMTAFYTFRAYFRTFEGELRMPEGAHPHEPAVMTVPLVVLAMGAVAVGIMAEPFTHWFSSFLDKSPSVARANVGSMDEHLNWGMMLASTAVALAGVQGAYYMYRVRPSNADHAAAAAGSLYFLSLNKLYVDEIYNLLIVQPFNLLAGICRLLEAVVYDVVRLIASIPEYMARVVRPLQNGLVQFYALAMAMGVAVFVGWLVLFAK
jgi:NADH:ubiquinone oxidoreductase subunit 5 (subunit L)/multisubunit Na+/H+ antiporter MnhA subunit